MQKTGGGVLFRKICSKYLIQSYLAVGYHAYFARFCTAFSAISWLFVMKLDHWKWLPGNLSITLRSSGVILCAKAQKQAACFDTAYGPVRFQVLALSCECTGLRMSRALMVECSGPRVHGWVLSGLQVIDQLLQFGAGRSRDVARFQR